ncbi:hypothetical protein CCACVL1_12574 [Corchorus capsularis]|uniref:Gag1-like clamp domain-containing protein n=1 Tax=Corchorus capsularis TaxID=210143 RepID=A0A1R3IF55_COCAP|nr:hypothetical protein CCACVL1_12574 [Corchorus capsularis]
MVTVNSLSSGCFGCCTKPTPIIAVDEPTKGLRIQGRIVRKPSLSDEYFWSTSTYDLENCAVQSQRSLSSISTSNPTLSQCGSTGGTANQSEFVNQGLIVWNQTRLQWIGNRRPRNHTQQSREPGLSWNASFESLLGTRNPFPQPIPLSDFQEPYSGNSLWAYSYAMGSCEFVKIQVKNLEKSPSVSKTSRG